MFNAFQVLGLMVREQPERPEVKQRSQGVGDSCATMGKIGSQTPMSEDLSSTGDCLRKTFGPRSVRIPQGSITLLRRVLRIFGVDWEASLSKPKKDMSKPQHKFSTYIDIYIYTTWSQQI